MSRFIPNSFQVPNVIIDELICDMTEAELKCFLLVIRKTTGWNKEMDAISISQFMELLKLSKQSIISGCEKLIQKGLLIKTTGFRGVNVFSLDLSRIQTSQNSRLVQNLDITSQNFRQDPVKILDTQNNNIQTNTNQKINISSEKISDGKKSAFSFSPDDEKTAHWIFGLLQNLKPNIRKPNFADWANTVRLMRERDRRTHREICELFRWANNDPFWRANILSPVKLREQWDKLELQRDRPQSRKLTATELNAVPWNTAEGWSEML